MEFVAVVFKKVYETVVGLMEGWQSALQMRDKMMKDHAQAFNE